MAGYNELRGLRVKYLSADPANPEDGQVWYNSTTGNLRVQGIGVAAWSSGAPLATAIFYNTGAGLQTAALSFGGSTSAPGTAATQTEEYNGSGWSIGGALPAGRVTSAGAGTQTAGLNAGGADAFPGTAQTTSEEYDGSTWTAGGALSTGRRYTAGCGTQTAAIVNGGQNPGGTSISDTEEYDGSTWTSGGAWPKAIRQHVLLGTQTATLGSGGYSTTTEVEAYEYNGSTWTATGDMNQQRYVFQGFGTQTIGVVCGGEPTPSAGTLTETYDGATFSNSPATLGNSTAQGGYGKSPGTAGIVFGNAAGGTTGATEEYNFGSTTVTPAAWSSGGAYPTATEDVGSAGTRTAGLIFSGQTPAPGVTTATNEYDGSTFSSGGATVVGRGFMTGLGTQTAAVGVGGAPSFIANSESYDGTSWSEGNDINTARGNAMGAGIQTAGLIFGGYNGSSLSNTENYDGTSWTNNPSSLNTARRGSGGCGTDTAALCAAGFATNFTAVVEEYNGSSWTNVTSVPLARNTFRLVGTQTAALGFGGYLPGPQGGPGNLPTNSITYDGTSWSTNPSLATGNVRGGQAGTTTSAFATAGQLGSGTTTENFDGETVTVNPASNLSVS